MFGQNMCMPCWPLRAGHIKQVIKNDLRYAYIIKLDKDVLFIVFKVLSLSLTNIAIPQKEMRKGNQRISAATMSLEIDMCHLI